MNLYIMKIFRNILFIRHGWLGSGKYDDSNDLKKLKDVDNKI